MKLSPQCACCWQWLFPFLFSFCRVPLNQITVRGRSGTWNVFRATKTIEFHARSLNQVFESLFLCVPPMPLFDALKAVNNYELLHYPSQRVCAISMDTSIIIFCLHNFFCSLLKLNIARARWPVSCQAIKKTHSEKKKMAHRIEMFRIAYSRGVQQDHLWISWFRIQRDKWQTVKNATNLARAY